MSTPITCQFNIVNSAQLLQLDDQSTTAWILCSRNVVMVACLDIHTFPQPSLRELVESPSSSYLVANAA